MAGGKLVASVQQSDANVWNVTVDKWLSWTVFSRLLLIVVYLEPWIKLLPVNSLLKKKNDDLCFALISLLALVWAWNIKNEESANKYTYNVNQRVAEIWVTGRDKPISARKRDTLLFGPLTLSDSSALLSSGKLLFTEGEDWPTTRERVENVPNTLGAVILLTDYTSVGGATCHLATR